MSLTEGKCRGWKKERMPTGFKIPPPPPPQPSNYREPNTKGSQMNKDEAYLSPIEAGVLLGQMRRSFPENVDRIFNYIALLHDLLEEADGEDTFGTEGWRHRYE